ncbi:hypothetical protein D5R40_29270 [Okeania hirsuta]|uniref:Uncharacterized protein n=1 Tax=Okeania hirsuta TaxID=1458930 RepID=A0A3N6ND70_9CYAN|nr:hypothetical protein [Okeania hirsuta]RQH09331.1 hypothetical protein D4Z78_28875 [Okeania hirsuta]RQH25694.1 hypothetical protein D5R40_29270 [Okeania hirsuta]
MKKIWIDSNVEVFVSWKTGDGNWFFPCGDRSNCYMNNGKLLVQKGRRHEAEGRREERLLYKLLNLF